MIGIRHAGLVVKDLKEALHFYRDLLGFKIVKKMVESGEYINVVCATKDTKVMTVKLAAGDNNLIELLCFFPPLASKVNFKKFNTPGFSHISCTVKNIEKEYKRLKEAGIRFNSLPQESPDGYAKVVFCRDPEGNFIELVEVLK